MSRLKKFEPRLERPRHADAAAYLARPIGEGRKAPSPDVIEAIVATLRDNGAKPRSREELAVLLEQAAPDGTAVTYALRKTAERVLLADETPTGETPTLGKSATSQP